MNKIIQIQAASVPNTMDTQCYVFLYALREDGSLLFKRDCDTKWTVLKTIIEEEIK